MKRTVAILFIAFMAVSTVQARELKEGEEMHHRTPKNKTQELACDSAESASRKEASSRDQTFVRVAGCDCDFVGIARDRPWYSCDFSWVTKDN